MQNWYAPSLTSNKEAGLGEWSIEEIVGSAAQRGVACAALSTARWRKSPSTACNISTMPTCARWRSISRASAQGSPPTPEAPTVPAPESSLLLNFGQTVYDTHCASCHAADGRGMPPDYPPLAGNPSIQMNRPSTRSAWC